MLFNFLEGLLDRLRMLLSFSFVRQFGMFRLRPMSVGIASSVGWLNSLVLSFHDGLEVGRVVVDLD